MDGSMQEVIIDGIVIAEIGKRSDRFWTGNLTKFINVHYARSSKKELVEVLVDEYICLTKK
jgi:hypothetical protein